MDQDTGLAVGYGECIVTPPLGLELAGYGYYLERRAQAILDELKARAVFVRSGQQTLLLICCDLIGLTVVHTDAIRQAIGQRLGIAETNILVACTHTHTGPATLPLFGVGEMDDVYVATLAGLVEQAAVAAQADCQPASLAYAMQNIEPIGYNRRTRSFQPIDSVLKVALFERAERSIVLTGYACHAVTLGRTASASADWPGGVVRAFERRGYHALAFQGFCGDIDPVVFMNAWGSGTPQDLDFYGELICQRALKSVAGAQREKWPVLQAVEERIALPLNVPPTRADVDRGLESLLATQPGAGAERMIRTWHAAASARYDELRAAPYIPNVPVQALALGGLRLLGLPGEVFSEYSTRLRTTWPTLFTVGYAGGCVSYIPTAEAYDHAGDYACYSAPRFFCLFPFERSVESLVLAASERVLQRLGRVG